MKKVPLLFAILFVSGMIAASIASVDAKNFNLPDGVNVVYGSGGGIGVVTVPTGWPVGGAHPAQLRISAVTVAAGTLGPSPANLEIDIPYTLPDGSATWLPMVYFVTGSNPNLVPWTTMLLSGFPAASLPGNIRVLSDSALKVDRLGNTVNVELTSPQTVLWGVVPITIPAFSIAFDKTGGSVHREFVQPLSGYPGASGWIGNVEQTGFNAKGVFTSTGWNSQMSDCFVIMHGVSTWTPP